MTRNILFLAMLFLPVSVFAGNSDSQFKTPTAAEMQAVARARAYVHYDQPMGLGAIIKPNIDCQSKRSNKISTQKLVSTKNIRDEDYVNGIIAQNNEQFERIYLTAFNKSSVAPSAGKFTAQFSISPDGQVMKVDIVSNELKINDPTMEAQFLVAIRTLNFCAGNFDIQTVLHTWSFID